MSVDKERQKLEAEADELNDRLAEEGADDQDDIVERINQIYERLEQMDATTAEVRASKILHGLGFTLQTLHKKTKDFSGGWRMRIALARALFIQPTLLLLDEPTNHLDMEAVVWLEDYLSKWDKILFLISHSQDFLNAVCTHMVHFTRKKLVYYSGNYDQFVKTQTELMEEQNKRYKYEQDQIAHMKEYVARFGQGNAKMARQAQSKEKTLEKMMRSGLTEKVEKEKPLDFNFYDPGALSPPVLQCNQISFGYPGCELLYARVDMAIDLDSRVALVGPNGAGKSTLLKILTGELQPVSGSVRPHPHLRISKFTQHFIDALDLSMTPLDYLMSLWPDLTREEARKFLGRFGCSGSVQTQPMLQLSDGQKSRVVFAKIAKEMPHLLFLDEPTNHLDMESIDSLAKAINSFPGGMVLVSHDMRLISQVANEIWICDNRTVSKYNGEISDFKMKIRRQMQKDNLIDADKVPINLAPPIPPPISMLPAKEKVESEEEAIRRARLELAEMAIAKQRARQAAEQTKGSSQTNETSDVSSQNADGIPSADSNNDLKSNEEDEEAIRKKAEKEAARAKKKAEKEAIALRLKQEEEEKERRRLEKLRDMEEARRLLEEQQRQREQWLLEKEQKEAAKRAKEAEEKAEKELLLQKRREEREARRHAKLAAIRKAEEEAATEAERQVLNDPWTQEQQLAFEAALLQYPYYVEKSERWMMVANAVEGKSRNQCMARYKFLKEFVAKKKAVAEAAVTA